MRCIHVSILILKHFELYENISNFWTMSVIRNIGVIYRSLTRNILGSFIASYICFTLILKLYIFFVVVEGTYLMNLFIVLANCIPYFFVGIEII